MEPKRLADLIELNSPSYSAVGVVCEAPLFTLVGFSRFAVLLKAIFMHGDRMVTPATGICGVAVQTPGHEQLQHDMLVRLDFTQLKGGTEGMYIATAVEPVTSTPKPVCPTRHERMTGIVRASTPSRAPDDMALSPFIIEFAPTEKSTLLGNSTISCLVPLAALREKELKDGMHVDCECWLSLYKKKENNRQQVAAMTFIATSVTEISNDARPSAVAAPPSKMPQYIV